MTLPRRPIINYEADAINSPPHYNQHPSGIECIQVVEHMPFNLGNIIKYVWRAPYKGNTLIDLKKAKYYLDREINRLEESKLS